MFSENQIRAKYKELLVEEFVDAACLWRVSLGLTNQMIDHLNQNSDSNHSHWTYDEFCVNSIDVIDDYLENFSFQKLYQVEKCDVHHVNPQLQNLFTDRDYTSLYSETSDAIIESRIVCLEKAIHKACTFDVLKRLLKGDFSRLENSLDKVYIGLQ